MYSLQQFLKDLRYTLNHFYEPNLLRLSPLAEVLSGQQRQTTNPRALQQLLTVAIEALRPPATTPLRSQAWRTYNLLLYRYLQQFSQEEVASQLGVSLRQLGREQSTALDALASYLWYHHALGNKWPAAGEASPDGSQAEPLGLSGSDQTRAEDRAQPRPDLAGDQPIVEPANPADDLSWLKNKPVERPTDLAGELATALEIVQPLASQHAVRLQAPGATGSEESPGLAMHDVVLRELLVSVLSAAIRYTPGGQVEIEAGSITTDGMVLVEIECLTAPGTERTPSEAAASLQMAQQLTELSRGQFELSTLDTRFNVRVKLPVFELWTVLMIDDNRDLQELFQRYVAGTRYHVIGLADPAHVIAAVTMHIPRAILLDVMMPSIDGWQLLGQLRQHPLTQAVPVVICTIVAEKDLALALGASDFLHKPVSQADLIQVLDRLSSAPAAARR